MTRYLTQSIASTLRRRIGVRLTRWAWPTAAALVALLPFAGGLSTTNVFFVRDLGSYFWPRHLWLWKEWRRGDWPWWDPHVGGGQSAVSDALNQFFLVPATLIRIFSPPVVGFNVWIAAPLPIMAVGTWLWLRHRVSPAAAFVGAAVATVAGPVVSTGNFPNLSWAVAAIPWILWSVDRFCRAGGPRRFAAVAAFVALQALAGEPVTFTATTVLVMAYAVAAMPAARWRELWARLLQIAAALAAGVLLSAVQMVPLLVAVSRSARGAGVDGTFWSLHPLALLEVVVPHLFGHVYYGNVETLPWVGPLNTGREPLFYSVYLGLGACVLAVISAGDSAVRRWRRFWWAVFAVALISALGEHTFAYPALQNILPVLKTFRFPVKYFVFAAFAIAALAASGAEAVLTHSRAAGAMTRPRRALILLGTVAVISALAGIAGVLESAAMSSVWERIGRGVAVDDPTEAARWLQGASPLWLRLSILATVMAFLTSIVWRRHPGAPMAAWILCGIAVLDPLTANGDLHPTMPADRLGPPEWVAATRAHPLDRVYVGGRLRKTGGSRQKGPADRVDAPTRFLPPADWAVQEALTIHSIQFAHAPAAWGVRELISYDLPQLWPQEYTQMLGRFRDAPPEDRLRFLRRTGVRYCFVPEPPYPGARPLAAPSIVDPMALYECHSDPRRVYVTDAARVEPDRGRQLDRLFDAEHDPFAGVLLERDPPPPAGEPGVGAAAPAAWIVRERNSELVVAAAVGASGGYLNVVDSHDPSWQVHVDGRPAVLLRGNGLFRAVRLAPGTHEVRFTYRPAALYVGLALTCITGVMMLAGCFWPWRRRPRIGDEGSGLSRRRLESAAAGESRSSLARAYLRLYFFV